MRAWKCTLCADNRLTTELVILYVKALDFDDAFKLINYAAEHYAVAAYPTWPVEVDPQEETFARNARVRFIPIRPERYSSYFTRTPK
jgi:hypothetical protein